MESFELKIVIEASPQQIFAALTEPKWLVKWDPATWILNDMVPGGRLRKRDEDEFLTQGEIVAFRRPNRYAYLWPVALDPDDMDDETFPVRFEFTVDGHGRKSLLTLSGTGFPTEELAQREKNTWGGYFLEKIKKIAEGIPASAVEEIKPSRTEEAERRQGHCRKTERATQYE